MNQQEQFALMVNRLAKNGDDIISDLTPLSAHLLHMAVGVSGEVAELTKAIVLQDKENAIEELGDIEFYLQGITNFMNLPIVVMSTELRHAPVPVQLTIYAGDLLDAIKKGSIYAKPFDVELVSQTISQLFFLMGEVYSELDVKREDVIQHNIEKLSKRYSGGSYSNEQAQLRADKEEGQ